METTFLRTVSSEVGKIHLLNLGEVWAGDTWWQLQGGLTSRRLDLTVAEVDLATPVEPGCVGRGCDLTVV